MVHCCVRPSVCRRLSVVCLWRYVLWLNGASQSKSYYYWEPIGSRIWEIDWYQNKWPWPLFRGRIKVMSTTALHSTLNTSETVRDSLIEAWFQRTTNRKWHMGYQMVTLTDDVTWPPKVLWGSTVGYTSDSLASCLVYDCIVYYHCGEAHNEVVLYRMAQCQHWHNKQVKQVAVWRNKVPINTTILPNGNTRQFLLAIKF